MQNQQVAGRPQVPQQESVQLVTKVQYSCGCGAVLAIFRNVKMLGKISVHAVAGLRCVPPKSLDLLHLHTDEPSMRVIKQIGLCRIRLQIVDHRLNLWNPLF